MGLDGKKVKPRRFFLAFLLVLLVVSACLTFFVYRYSEVFFIADGTSARRRSGMTVNSHGYKKTDIAQNSSALGWRGVVSVTAEDNAVSEITIAPTTITNQRVFLTSFQIYLRSPDGKNEEDITSRFSKDASGVIRGKMEGKPAGPWLLRIRLHTDLSTLEFTERIAL